MWKLPEALLFWRSMTHWIGGMGIIVLALAILPLLELAECSCLRLKLQGLAATNCTLGLLDTAKRLWLIYLGYTLAETGHAIPRECPCLMLQITL